MTDTASCKGCTERHPHCHSECKRYAAFRAKIDEASNNRRKYIDTMGGIIENVSKQAKRSWMRSNKGRRK